MKRGHSVCLPLVAHEPYINCESVMDVPYVTHETRMTCLSYIRKLHRWLQEITRRSGRVLAANVEPFEPQGPPGSSLLWSVTCAKVL